MREWLEKSASKEGEHSSDKCGGFGRAEEDMNDVDVITGVILSPNGKLSQKTHCPLPNACHGGFI